MSLSAFAQRSVTLTCQDSPDKAANLPLAYNFYRAQVSGGPYVVISTTPQTSCSFTDNNVQVGQTYFYVVTAMLNGTESQYSNEASAEVAGISSASVTVTSPVDGSTVSTTAHVVASSPDGAVMRIYVDDVNVYEVSSDHIDTNISLSVGQHWIVIVAWDSPGNVSTQRVTVTASNSAGSSPSTGVTVTLPASGATVTSPVHFVANEQGAIAMHIYVDYQLAYQVNADQLDTALAMGGGAHQITVQGWDQAGTVTKNSFAINVSGDSSGTSS